MHSDFILTDRDIKNFWSRTTEHPSGCLLWTGEKTVLGYGLLRLENQRGTRRRIYAHRIAMALEGQLPPERCHVCHKCDNPSCVNHAHLFVGSARDNHHDRMMKNRSTRFDGMYPYGVHRVGARFYARVHFDGREIGVSGGFSTPDEAHLAAMDLKNKLLGIGGVDA